MVRELAGLVALNFAYALVGFAALSALGWLTRDSSTWPRIGVAFPLGLVIVVVPASYLALFQVPVAIGAAVVGIAVCAFAVVRTRPWRAVRLPAVRLRRPGPAVAIAAVLAVLLAYSARTFAIRPLVEWDSWVVWMSKARLLYEDPSAAPAALRSGDYGQAAYPLALPTLEALGFRAMGQFDGTVIAVQLLLLACGFPLALWSLLRTRARPWMIALASLAIVGAPQILFQLLTRYADVPLGLFVGLGLAAGGAWLVGDRRDVWLLGCFAAFLGMAGVTKNEGFLFALAGIAALAAGVAVTRERARIHPAAFACGAVLVVILPWRVYCAVYGLSSPDYDLGHALDPAYLAKHADRLGPSARELWRQLTATHSWGLLTWAILLALVAGVVAARWRVLAFLGAWLVLATAGLLLTYWISRLPVSSRLTNTSYRTIVSLLVGGGALLPLFVFPLDERRSR